MKNTKIILTAAILAMTAAISSCTAAEMHTHTESAKPAAPVTAVADEPDIHSETTISETEAATSASETESSETESETSFTGFKDPHAVTPEELDAFFADHPEEDAVIHLPNQTAEEGFTPAEPVTGTGKTVSNKVFIISVDPDTTDAMIQEVINKFSLEVIYDYESFSMYALAVPEALDAEGTAKFINELIDNYSFILSVEPDSVVTLDAQVPDGGNMLF